MEVQTDITKKVFEDNVPSAKMPATNTSVFSRLSVMLQTAYDMLVQRVIGQSFVSTAEDDSTTKDMIKRLVCLNAFERTMRSMDLVLTATGFGIVSTESTAPASRARVDALMEEVRCEQLRTLEDLKAKLTQASGWGTSPQAASCIPILFYAPSMLMEYTAMTLTYENWQRAFGIAVTADTLLRKEISQEYMEELLVKARTAALTNADIIIMGMCNRFTGSFISNYDQTHGLADRNLLDAIMQQLENYVDSYPTYKSSAVYRKRHADRYQNRKDDPTFFFM